LVTEILSHQSLRNCLRKFLIKAKNVENLDFLDQVLLYNSRSISSQEVRAQKACEIYSRFIPQNTARDQINIGNEVRQELTAALGQCPNAGAYRDAISADVFARADREITAVLGRDTVNRFRLTPEYTECVGKAMVEKQLRNFGTLLDLFCTEERNSFAGRALSRKLGVQALIRSYWNKRCKADNTFTPPVLTRGRS
jgi:hypothetical protein